MVQTRSHQPNRVRTNMSHQPNRPRVDRRRRVRDFSRRGDIFVPAWPEPSSTPLHRHQPLLDFIPDDPSSRVPLRRSPESSEDIWIFFRTRLEHDKPLLATRTRDRTADVSWLARCPRDLPSASCFVALEPPMSRASSPESVGFVHTPEPSWWP